MDAKAIDKGRILAGSPTTSGSLTWLRAPAIATLAAAALLAGTAQAADEVYWSLGMGAPGVAVGVGNVPPAVVKFRDTLEEYTSK